VNLRRFAWALVIFGSAAAAAAASSDQENGDRWFGPEAQPGMYTIGSLDPQTGYVFAVELTAEGAAVNTVKLTNHFATVDDKKLAAKYHTDYAAYEAARKANPHKYKGHYSVLNPVSHGAKRFRPLATEGLIVEFDGADATETLNLDGLGGKLWSLDHKTDDSITFSYWLFRGPSRREATRNPILRITKTYQVRKKDYSIAVSLRLENLSARPIKVTLNQLGPTGLPREDLRRDMRQGAYAYFLHEDKRVQLRLKPNSELHNDKKMKLGQPIYLGASCDRDAMLWVGHVNKFFGAMMYLKPSKPGRLEASTHRADFYVKAVDETDSSRTFLTGVQIPELQLAPGQAQQLTFDLFVGPKKRDMFSDEKAPYFKPLYKDLNYLSTIDFGGCCTWPWLSLAMLWLLGVFSHVALGNYGVAIIVLVVLVRIALHPLTKKAQVSMMGMQKLAPQMQKLKEKYADDKETLNKEMMKFYKQQGATPLLGCLPMLLQMPIWIALFTGLNAAVELRHAAFLPVWITDLAAPDALVRWTQPLSAPMIGSLSSLNLLPILLTVAMFFQTKLNPQMTQTTASPEQTKQQNMMKYMMPLMMLLFFYNAPSGLTLYIMASTFAGVAEQLVIRRHIQAKEAAAAAVETTVRLPGKGPRASRPKKPKGPFWVKRG